MDRSAWSFLLFVSIVFGISYRPSEGQQQQVDEPKLRTQVKAHAHAAHGLAFSPDSKLLASASGDKTVKLWDVAAGQVIATLGGHAGSVWAVTFSPDGKTLVAGSGLLNAKGDQYVSGEVKIWNVAQRRATAILGGHRKMVNSLDFSPDGKLLASASDDGTVKTWRVVGDELSYLRDVYDAATVPPARPFGFPTPVSSAVFSPDGKMLAWPDSNQDVVLWEVAAGQQRTSLKGHKPHVRSLIFSPDGKTLVSCADDCIKVWDVLAGKERSTLPGNGRIIYAVALSPDERYLISGGHDGVVRQWDLATDNKKTILEDENNSIYTIRFSPDGLTLVAARSDGSVVFWDVSPGAKAGK
jgi:WD40 repeat protein